VWDNNDTLRVLHCNQSNIIVEVWLYVLVQVIIQIALLALATWFSVVSSGQQQQ
jgi:hypothetical protein